MKCIKCGCEFAEGIFCPECGYKYDPEEAKAEEERLLTERTEKERLAKEKAAEEERKTREKMETERALAEAKAKAKQMEKEKIEQERMAREQEEQNRKAREQEEQLRLEQERVSFLKAENEKIDLLKIRLEGTNSQVERQKIMGEFQDDIQSAEAKKRLELLRQKVNQPVPGAEKNNRYVGLVSVVLFVLSVIACSFFSDNDSIVTAGVVVMTFALIGIVVWFIRKLLIMIRSKSKRYYLNIKDI